MSKYKYSETEQEINSVLAHQQKELEELSNLSQNADDSSIAESEQLLRKLGYGAEVEAAKTQAASKSHNYPTKVVKIPSWDEVYAEALESVGDKIVLEDLFTKEELRANEAVICQLNDEYNALHKLDKYDYIICACAGLLGAAIDLFLVGIPGPSVEGLKAGTLSDYIRKTFEKKYPPEEMEKLGKQAACKTPFDAQDNRNTVVDVEGLSSYYHRLLSLGHDPLLGFVVGVFDIMTGRMTTIDKGGKIVSQVIDSYKGRIEPNLFKAIAKQVRHLKSDLTTSMGLPTPLMGLFNLLQFGSIGEEEQTIAEIVQEMYYEGYDFIHFCSTSIPVLVTETIVRIAYTIKRMREGHSMKESLAISTNREKHPKLATMLFISHSAAAAVNAGKVCFTKNPMAINYSQWIAFARFSYKQLKWWIVEKPEARAAYVSGELNEELSEAFKDTDNLLEEFSAEFKIVFE